MYGSHLHLPSQPNPGRSTPRPRDLTPVQLPTINPSDFWHTIASAWSALPNGETQLLLLSPDAAARASARVFVAAHRATMLAHLKDTLDAYPLPQLQSWKAHYNAARAAVCAVTGERAGETRRAAFVVACGREFVEAFCGVAEGFEGMDYAAFDVAQRRWGAGAFVSDHAVTPRGGGQGSGGHTGQTDGQESGEGPSRASGASVDARADSQGTPSAAGYRRSGYRTTDDRTFADDIVGDMTRGNETGY